MTTIHIQTPDGGTHKVDDISQRLLVYLQLHGDTPPKEILNPVGVDSHREIESRVKQYLGPEKAGLVEESGYVQTKFSGQQEERRYQLTDKGTSFVYENKASLSMPADLGNMAKKVAELRIEQDELSDLRYEVDAIEGRLSQLEERLDDS